MRRMRTEARAWHGEADGSGSLAAMGREARRAAGMGVRVIIHQVELNGINLKNNQQRLIAPWLASWARTVVCACVQRGVCAGAWVVLRVCVEALSVVARVRGHGDWSCAHADRHLGKRTTRRKA